VEGAATRAAHQSYAIVLPPHAQLCVAFGVRLL